MTATGPVIANEQDEEVALINSGSGSQIAFQDLTSNITCVTGASSGVSTIDARAPSATITVNGTLNSNMTDSGCGGVHIFSLSGSTVTLNGPANFSTAGTVDGYGAALYSDASTLIANEPVTITNTLTGPANAYGTIIGSFNAGNLSINDTLDITSSKWASFGVLAIGGNLIFAGKTTIGFTGSNSSAIFADGPSSVVTGTASATTTITLSGDNNMGVQVLEAGAIANLASDVTITHTGAANPALPSLGFEVLRSAGVRVADSGVANFTGSLNVTTTDPSTFGLLVEGDTPTLDGSAMTSGSVNSAAIAAELNTGVGQVLKLNRTTLSNSAGDLILATASGSTASPSSIALSNSTATAVTGANVLDVVSNSVLNVTATGSTLSGKITADATSTANITLTGNSMLTGAVDPVNQTITAGSVWNMTANSIVNNLSNAGSINFVDATLPPAFTLTVNGALVGTSPGVVALHTVLNTDGSASDTIVLDGASAAASGVTQLSITNAGGVGGFTTGNGILVVSAINGATTAAGSFVLSAPVTVTTNGVTYHYVLVQVGQNWYLQSLVAAQVITFPAQAGQTYASGGTFPLNPAATASSGLAVTYSSTTPAVCTISGSTVSIVGVGACTIAANQAGNANFTAAPQVTQNIAIGPASQTITFGAQPGQTYVSGGSFALNPAAVASSGLAVTYTSTTPAVCTITGTTVVEVSAGSCAITANQAGNANYTAAAPVTQIISIGQTSQTITFGAQPAQSFVAGGTFALSPVATASSGLTVTYTSTSPAVCSITGTTVTILSAGTCSIAANQAGNANVAAAAQVVQPIAIGVATQTITFGPQPNRAFVANGTFALNPAATASSGLPVAYSSATPSVCSIVNTTVTMLTAGACTITASQAGNANISAAAPVSQSITLTAAPPTPTAVAAPTLSNAMLLALIGLMTLLASWGVMQRQKQA
jgi:hypothetical protein